MGFDASFIPVNNKCLDCGDSVDPKKDRQELAWDDEGNCRRRCGKCIQKLTNEVHHYVRYPNPNADSGTA